MIPKFYLVSSQGILIDYSNKIIKRHKQWGTYIFMWKIPLLTVEIKNHKV